MRSIIVFQFMSAMHCKAYSVYVIQANSLLSDELNDEINHDLSL